jgi:hypothetical protein
VQTNQQIVQTNQQIVQTNQQIVQTNQQIVQTSPTLGHNMKLNVKIESILSFLISGFIN